MFCNATLFTAALALLAVANPGIVQQIQLKDTIMKVAKGLNQLKYETIKLNGLQHILINPNKNRAARTKSTGDREQETVIMQNDSTRTEGSTETQGEPSTNSFAFRNSWENTDIKAGSYRLAPGHGLSRLPHRVSYVPLGLHRLLSTRAKRNGTSSTESGTPGLFIFIVLLINPTKFMYIRHGTMPVVVTLPKFITTTRHGSMAILPATNHYAAPISGTSGDNRLVPSYGSA
ncbi:hypothetical protein BU17DRAFT_70428 [Hysterangium stoloniferum]|nr:hypothetical protein BU17DRAFT_70428 [Hysterangium stoloniferum]